ncbi:glutamine synthetase family protein [Candidatus Thioglobus sp. NP1]|jgi:glutamine synthetase|uniref:glutamine synthetase family protein n=1 Tax=Candidatus Thioglobus sp. NP1 TaxID=2508687 RepID=UPI000DEDEFE3|nr:glutamine synthetase family protein [Candidatus Thioglobus sp. NP1]AXE62519.1 glutamate--putrescine ligase [Candidatus Thioglobus sp. NP1]|tara:strand:+ start:1225 stop:2583 length:1359 start_codon:yes stop_codon:yes gene_type:complete
MKNIATKFLDENPELEKIEFIYVDFNGIPRGKNASPKTLIKASEGGLKMPISSYVLDVWGDNPKGTGLVMSGDGDAICRIVESSLAITPWSSRNTAQCIVSMEDGNGDAIYADPRNVLNSILSRFKNLGLRPVIAPEMEFYLIDKQLQKNGHPQMPLIPGTNRRYEEVQLLNLSEMDDFEEFFELVEKSAISLGIPAETAIKECAPGQFEINLLHHDDALLMADQAFLMKRLIKNCARKFNLNATFMAKPFSEEAGNGMHAHLSIIDKDGKNIFKVNKNKQPQGVFASAIAGLLKNAPDFLSFYAPHSNSYRRLVHNADHAPTTLSWGNENRTALVRLPEASNNATRLEFRLPSADSNPYLVFASILASVLNGIENEFNLEKETIGNAHAQHEPELGITWREAVHKTSVSSVVKEFFGDRFQQSYQCVKESEIKRFESTITDFEYNSYLRHL